MSRRRRILCVAASAVLATAGAACRQADEALTPTGAVRAFDKAADLRSSARDRERVCTLIGPTTRARLQEGARLATQQAGARAPLDWKDMLIIGMARPRYKLQDVRLLEVHGDRARVEVQGSGGERETIEVVREGELWKVELPPPREEAAASQAASAPGPQPTSAPTP